MPNEKMESDPVKQDKLHQFRDMLAEGRVVDYAKNTNEMPAAALAALAHAIRVEKPTGWIRTDALPNRELSAKYAQLVQENADLKEEIVKISNSISGEIELPELLDKRAPIPEESFASFLDVTPTWGDLLCELGPSLRVGASSPVHSNVLEAYFKRVNQFSSSTVDISYTEKCLMTFEHLGLLIFSQQADEYNQPYSNYLLTEVGVRVLLAQTAKTFIAS